MGAVPRLQRTDCPIEEESPVTLQSGTDCTFGAVLTGRAINQNWDVKQSGKWRHNQRVVGAHRAVSEAMDTRGRGNRCWPPGICNVKQGRGRQKLPIQVGPKDTAINDCDR